MKPWNNLKIKYNLRNETYFHWLQLKHGIAHKRKTIIKQKPGNVSDLLIQDHHFLKGARILTLEKLSSKELYSILITKFTKNLYQMFANLENFC